MLPALAPLDVWLPTPVRGEVTALAGRGLHVAAALRSGDILVSEDGGSVWQPTALLTGRPTITALTLLPDAILIGTAGQGLLRAQAEHGWGGTGTSALPGRTVLSLAQRGQVVMAGTLRGGVFRSTDGGRSWSTVPTGLPLLGDGLEVSQLVSTRRAWYALHPFGVSESHDDGLHWRLVVAGLPLYRAPTMLAAVGDVVIAEAGARLYRLGLEGRWQMAGDEQPVWLAGQADEVLFAVISDGRALGYSTDAGRTWHGVRHGLPAAGLVTAVGGTRRTVLLALGGDGLWSRCAPTKPDAEPGPRIRSRVAATLRESDPNPFSETTVIPFSLSAEAEVLLTVHDVGDAEVVRLAEGRYPAGEHSVVFAPTSSPAGLYNARLVVDGQAFDRPMLLLA